MTAAQAARPILVGLALREDDAAPLALARTLAAVTGAPLALATVYPYDSLAPVVTIDYAKAIQERAHGELEAAAARLRPAHEVTTHVCQGSRAGGLHALADELRALCVVVGSSSHGTAGRVLAGDLAAGLLHGASCPVAVAPRGHEGGALRWVGVAFRDTEEGRQAATAGFGLARRTGAAVRLITVVEPLGYSGGYVTPGWAPPVTFDPEALERSARSEVEDAAAELGEGVRTTVEVLHGPVIATLADASHGLDVLVCGSRGYGALHSVLASGVSRGLAHAAACPLLLVPRRLEDGAAALWLGREAAGAP